MKGEKVAYTVSAPTTFALALVVTCCLNIELISCRSISNAKLSRDQAVVAGDAGVRVAIEMTSADQYASNWDSDIDLRRALRSRLLRIRRQSGAVSSEADGVDGESLNSMDDSEDGASGSDSSDEDSSDDDSSAAMARFSKNALELEPTPGPGIVTWLSTQTTDHQQLQSPTTIPPTIVTSEAVTMATLGPTDEDTEMQEDTITVPTTAMTSSAITTITEPAITTTTEPIATTSSDLTTTTMTSSAITTITEPAITTITEPAATTSSDLTTTTMTSSAITTITEPAITTITEPAATTPSDLTTTMPMTSSTPPWRGPITSNSRGQQETVGESSGAGSSTDPTTLPDTTLTTPTAISTTSLPEPPTVDVDKDCLPHEQPCQTNPPVLRANITDAPFTTDPQDADKDKPAYLMSDFV